MCGRAYITYTDDELEMRMLNESSKRNPLGIKPNYNLAPTQLTPIVRVGESGEKQLELFNWGLIPAWSPEFKTKFSTINAKSETVFESKLYKNAAIQRRCLVPLSGFFEWKLESEKIPKRPFRIYLKEEPIMCIAGIWETWRAGTPEERHSFSILTMEANAFMDKIHHRMPVILPRSAEDTWLDPELHEPAEIKKLFKTYDSDAMAAVEISTRVNSPKNNNPDVLRALQDGN